MRLHTNRLSPDEITQFAGLPATTVARTIVDVASSGLADGLVIQAIHQAIHKGLVTAAGLRAYAETYGRRAQRLVRQALQGVTA